MHCGGIVAREDSRVHQRFAEADASREKANLGPRISLHHRSQAKAVAWGLHQVFCIAHSGIEISKARLRVDYPNGGRIRFMAQTIMMPCEGLWLYFDDIVLDEYADMDPRVWPQVVRPALSDRNGAGRPSSGKGPTTSGASWNGDAETGGPARSIRRVVPPDA